MENDTELRKKLMDQFVTDAAYGLFMRTTNPFRDPGLLIYTHNLTKSLPEGIMRKELGVINLTAQFMAVYGIFFQRALIKKVIMDPRFEFMTKVPDHNDDKHSVYYGLRVGYIPTDNSKFSFYCRLFRGYIAVSRPCQELTKNAGASPETVLEGFFDLLAQLEKQEEDEGGMDKIGIVDLHALEFFGDTLVQKIPFPPTHDLGLLEPWSSQIAELLMTPVHERPEDFRDQIRSLEIKLSDLSSRRFWRTAVSYHACYQQMQILSQDHAFCENPPSPSLQPKDLQKNSDQGPTDLRAAVLSSLWNDLPPPKFTSLIPEGITSKELGIIKLTAQFEAVYGLYFRDNIDKKVIADPRFEFLKQTNSMCSFFTQLSLGYGRVLIPSRKKEEALIPLRKLTGSPSLETVLEGFWNLVEMVEEGVVDMGMVDMHAFEFFANTEDQELNLPPQYLLMMMHPLIPPFAHLHIRIPHCHFPHPPQREHPNPKRLKVDN
ncbi:uncharacterized protein LOC111832412 [Capsella rubella]|uniref:uncharacterized protein LOC111832412 n=1 Tax=Capsella rubella TaxID=81985 RepID=UPI000CD55535|nr:uncharacterized protein LOC111832412 [Capsella rubella]